MNVDIRKLSFVNSKGRQRHFWRVVPTGDLVQERGHRLQDGVRISGL